MSIEEQSNDFTVAPNPFNAEIEISSNQSMKEIKIIDLSGKIVASVAVDSSSKKMNLDYLTSGVYTITVETADSISTSRIIKK